MMELINVVIDETIQEKDVGEDGKVPSFKKNESDGNMFQSDDGQRQLPEKESTPTTSRRETRSTQGSLGLLTPSEVQLPISMMRNPPLPRNLHQE